MKIGVMKYLFFFLALVTLQNSAIAQQEPGFTKIFIVRHAEKESGKDPLLTAAGNARAGDLMRVLQNEGIQKIYVSQYRRTQNTGDSLRLQLKIDTVQYAADTLCDNLINAIMVHSDFGKTILIIGHSNTLPQIIRKLGVTDYPYGDIPDNEFDNLFVITYKKEKAKVKVMKYGAKSGASAAMK
ncbi:MAG: histidine phosphatase family protein [Chitinophagaceae bacterium]|nr:histidine phosphatase family protein [Chitinophagaceae bacterium]